MPDPGALIRRWRNRFAQPPPKGPTGARELACALRSGRPAPLWDRHLDELLLWLSNPEHPRAAELERAIGEQRLSRAQARAAALRLLDQHLFAAADGQPAQTLGLESGVDLSVAKQRYRRLIQVYHPDRHPNRADWATRRTEQINRAWSALQRGETPPKRGPQPASRRTEQSARPQAPSGLSRWVWARLGSLKEWLDGRLSGRGPFERRLILALGILGILALFALLWPEERPRPTPRIVHQPVANTPPRIIGLDPSPPPLPAEPSSEPVMTPAADKDSKEDSKPQPLPPRAQTAPAAEAQWAERPKEPGPQPLAEARPVPNPAASEPSLPLPAPIFPWPGPDLLLDRPRRPPAASIPGPEPPKAPLVPQAIVPGAEPESLALTVTPNAGRCISAANVLERFKEAYQEGALDRLMALYSPLARENDLANWFDIRRAYDAWFQLTLLRRIDFNQIQVQSLPDGQRCVIRTRYQVAYLDQGARLVTQSGDLDLLLESKGAEWLILEARY